MAAAVKAFAPDADRAAAALSAILDDDDRVVLARLDGGGAAIGLAVPTKLVCCYPTEPGFVAAAAALVRAGLARGRGKAGRRPRVLFSAHGLPKKIVARGDPYPAQVDADGARHRGARSAWPTADWTVCYQSRVGPLEWIGPYTDAEIRRAGREGVAVVLFPIAFVSEHSETLVELDIDYRHVAEQAGVPGYVRVPTVGTDAGLHRRPGRSGARGPWPRRPGALASRTAPVRGAAIACCVNPAA